MFTAQNKDITGVKTISAGLPNGELQEYVISDIPYRNGIFLLSREEQMPALGAHLRLNMETADRPCTVDAVVACRTNQGFGVEIIK